MAVVELQRQNRTRITFDGLNYDLVQRFPAKDLSKAFLSKLKRYAEPESLIFPPHMTGEQIAKFVNSEEGRQLVKRKRVTKESALRAGLEVFKESNLQASFLDWEKPLVGVRLAQISAMRSLTYAELEQVAIRIRTSSREVAEYLLIASCYAAVVNNLLFGRFRQRRQPWEINMLEEQVIFALRG